MGVSHFMWSDALLTSTYLLNLLPSSPLGGEVPLCHLHPNHDLFALLPWVFGCLAFVHDHTPNTSKVAPHSVKGMFVGYLCTQKAIGSIFHISASMLSWVMLHSLSLVAISPPLLEPSLSPLPTSSLLSSPANTFHLPTLMVPAPFLSLSPPSSPTPLLYSTTSPLLMPPTMSPVPISTQVSLLPPANSSTSCSNSMHIALPSDDLHYLPIWCKTGHKSPAPD